ncbi:MAG: GNAT family N-acetyltransferase [bacterium]|nr:GNAT family N-acetyltransferase [bacterium]
MDRKVIAYKSEEYYKTVELRDRVLRKPLGLVFTEEFLAQDADDYHLGLFENGELLAVLILQVVDAKTVKMRQVAVSPERQGSGLGREIVEFSESFAGGKGFERVILHARETAVPFYRRLDYRIIGEKFFEIGLPHFKMEKPQVCKI